jgi:hypothetical protein
MLYFSEDGKTVSTEYYSTIRDQYFMTENMYTFELDLVGDDDGDTDNDNGNGNGNNVGGNENGSQNNNGGYADDNE